MGEDLEAGSLAVRRHTLGVDGDDDALRAEFLRCRAHQGAILHRRRIDRDFVGAGFEQSTHVVGAAHAAADGQRHEAAFGRAGDHVEDRAALLVAGGDVEEAELVGPRLVVSGGGLDRIARVSEVDEVDALDDAALFHVEAGYDADLQHESTMPCLAGRPSQPKNTIAAAMAHSTNSTKPAGSDR